jgi:hypothetical protein
MLSLKQEHNNRHANFKLVATNGFLPTYPIRFTGQASGMTEKNKRLAKSKRGKQIKGIKHV